MGVTFRYGVTVRGITRRGGAIASVQTSAGDVVADTYVVALGSFTPGDGANWARCLAWMARQAAPLQAAAA